MAHRLWSSKCHCFSWMQYNPPWHVTKKTFLMLAEDINNGAATRGAYGMCSGGSAKTQALISAHPPPLVSESCQMIREPAQQLFGRNKQHKVALCALVGFWLSTKRANFISAVFFVSYCWQYKNDACVHFHKNHIHVLVKFANFINTFPVLSKSCSWWTGIQSQPPQPSWQKQVYGQCEASNNWVLVFVELPYFKHKPWKCNTPDHVQLFSSSQLLVGES